MTVKGSILHVNETLQVGDSLVSPNGTYVAYLDDRGVLGLYKALSGTAGQPDLSSCYWQRGPAGGSQPRAVMQGDTNFVLYHDGDIPYFASNTVLNIPAITALLDDGNLVVCTGTSATDTQEILWSALPTISATCKLMQNYRVTVPVNGGPQVLAIKTSAGIELFTLGTGGNIHTFYPDPASETGYSQTALTSGINFTNLAGATDAAGHAVLFASSGQQIYVLAESGDPDKRWGSPQPVPTALMTVTDLVARTIGSTVILMAIQQDSGGYYWPAVLRWGIDDKVNPNGALKYGGTRPLPLLQFTSLPIAGSPVEPTAAMVTPGKLIQWGLTTGKLSTVPLNPAPVMPLAVDVTTDGSGAEWVVAALPAGSPVCRMTPATGAGYNWTPLWPALSYDAGQVSFQQVVAEADASGSVHIFAVSAALAVVDGDKTQYNLLYHLPPSTDTSLDPQPIHKNVGMRLAGVANDAGSIDLFTVEAANLVDHIFAEQDGSNWVTQRVLDPAGDDAPFTEYSSYATDITVYDLDQAILVGEYVNVYAGYKSRVEINGLTYFLDEQVPAAVQTNGAGMLCISQETGSLASAPLRVVFTSSALANAKAPVIEVEPYADVHHKLGTASAQDLLDAQLTTDDNGGQSPLLQGDYRTGTTPQSLADALDTFLGGTYSSGNLGSATLLAAPGPASPAGLAAASSVGSAVTAGTGRTRDRFWTRQVPDGGSPHRPPARRLAPVRADRPGRITFREGGLTYERLTAEQAADLRTAMTATLPSVTSTGWGKFWSKIGDALQAVVDGIANVAEVIWDGLTATVEMIIDGVKYAFNTVVQFLEDAFDMVEMIFTKVKVFFQQLYRWLALIFDWTSIKQAARCVTWSFDQMMLFMEGMVTGLSQIVDARYAAFKSQFADMMEQAISSVSGYSVGGYVQRNSPYDADADSATSNNFYLNEFTVNSGSSTLSPSPAAVLTAGLATSDPVTTLADLLTELSTTEMPTTEFSDALGYFTTLGTSPDEMFTNLLSGMLKVLKGIGLIGLDLGAKIVDALLAAVNQVIETLRQAVKQTISIPFVSAFYKWITGLDLSLISLIGLATGIPAAVLYAITTGERMFTANSGPGSADDFEAVVTADAMLQAIGFAPQGRATVTSTPKQVTKKEANTYAGLYLAVTSVGGILTSADEWKTRSWQYPLTMISWGSMACSALSVLYSYPSFYAPAASMSEEEDVWMAGCLALVVVAFLYTLAKNSLPEETSSDIMVIAYTFAGAGMLAQAAYLSMGEQDGRLVAWRILKTMPWVCKLLKYSGVQRATATFSLWMLAQLDVYFGYANGILGYLVLRERYNVIDS